MDSKIIPAHNGKFVTKTTTPSGAVLYLASDVPDSAVRGLLKKLTRKVELTKRKLDESAKAAAGAGRRSKSQSNK